MTDLTPIIARAQALTEPSREVDALIAVALKWELPAPMGECSASLRIPMKWDHCEPGTYWLVQRSGSSLRTAPAFTASTDAALALAERVLPGWTIQLLVGTGRRVAILSHQAGDNERWSEAEGANIAIAICIATLEAKMEDEDG